MKKTAMILGLLLVACGGNSASTSYQKDQLNITENSGNRFSIVMPMGDSMSQSISCHIDKECNSQVAKLVDIKIEGNEMLFNFEAIGAGETSVGIKCTGSVTENHMYNIVVE
ncbi:MAG: hypothetical protein IT286_03015 [Proteobacteria bacterium]|nr:hypothetical protein [Pseudomonadota bacterium]